MNIEVQCSCGRTISVSSRLAGKKVKCPYCGGIVRVQDLAEPEPIDPDEAESEPAIIAEVVPEEARTAEEGNH